MVRSAARLVPIGLAAVFRAAYDDQWIIDRGGLVVDEPLSARRVLAGSLVCGRRDEDVGEGDGLDGLTGCMRFVTVL